MPSCHLATLKTTGSCHFTCYKRDSHSLMPPLAQHYPCQLRFWNLAHGTDGSMTDRVSKCQWIRVHFGNQASPLLHEGCHDAVRKLQAGNSHSDQRQVHSREEPSSIQYMLALTLFQTIQLSNYSYSVFLLLIV